MVVTRLEERDGTLTVLSGGIINNTNGQFIGIGTTNSAASGTGVANVTGDINRFDDIDVGVVRDNIGSSSGTATGQLTVTGDVHATRLQVGRAEFFTLGDASGAMTVTGSLFGDGGGGIRVGVKGGSGGVDGTLGVGGDVLNVFNVEVGVASSFASGNVSGDLTVGGLMQGTFSGGLVVGRVVDGDLAVGTAEIGGGIQDHLAVIVGTGGFIGAVGSLGDGTLTVSSGGITNNTNGQFIGIGVTNSDGSAKGVADITGGIDHFNEIDVGVVGGAGSQGNATGRLAVTGGPVNAANIRVGFSEGIGTASATVILDELLATIDDTLALGDGSTLQLNMDGTIRGVNFAAIDANTALLDGVLKILFTFELTALTTFDLIISGSPNGIGGDFASFNVMGLDNGIVTSKGVVLDNFGDGPVEVYRMIVDVPEPGTTWLLGAGLLGMILVMRIRRRIAVA